MISLRIFLLENNVDIPLFIKNCQAEHHSYSDFIPLVRNIWGLPDLFLKAFLWDASLQSKTWKEWQDISKKWEKLCSSIDNDADRIDFNITRLIHTKAK